MPNTKQAKKFIRSTNSKTSLNNSYKKAFRGAIRELEEFVKEGKMTEAKKAFIKVQKALDKAAKKGVIKKNTAARKKSRLARKLRKK